MVVPLRTRRRVLMAGVCLVAATAFAPRRADAQASGEPMFCGVPMSDYATGRRQRPRLLPVDQSAREPELVALRRALLDAVAKHDVDTIVRNAAGDIVLGFEGERGPEEFRRLIESNETEWVEFGRALALGGSFEGDTFVAPYVTSAWETWNPGSCDRVIVGQHVRLRASPSVEAPVLAMLDYDLVEDLYSVPIDGDNVPVHVPDGWSRVRIASGAVGYVSATLLRSPIDHRVHFERRDGRRRIVAFVAGD